MVPDLSSSWQERQVMEQIIHPNKYCRTMSRALGAHCIIDVIRGSLKRTNYELGCAKEKQASQQRMRAHKGTVVER